MAVPEPDSIRPSDNSTFILFVYMYFLASTLFPVGFSLPGGLHSARKIVSLSTTLRQYDK